MHMLSEHFLGITHSKQLTKFDLNECHTKRYIKEFYCANSALSITSNPAEASPRPFYNGARFIVIATM